MSSLTSFSKDSRRPPLPGISSIYKQESSASNNSSSTYYSASFLVDYQSTRWVTTLLTSTPTTRQLRTSLSMDPIGEFFSATRHSTSANHQAMGLLRHHASLRIGHHRVGSDATPGSASLPPARCDHFGHCLCRLFLLRSVRLFCRPVRC